MNTLLKLFLQENKDIQEEEDILCHKFILWYLPAIFFNNLKNNNFIFCLAEFCLYLYSKL